MAAIRPNYHPSSASEQINVTNNLDYTDTLCWYDEQSVDSIKFPSIFTYKKTSGWDENLNLKLKSVILNSSSGSIKNTSPNLPSSEGSFEATLQLQNNNPPTMDLYFNGNIRINKYFYPTFSDDWPEELKNAVYAGREGWDFTVTNNYFPSSENITVGWNHSGSAYVEPEYYDWNGSRYTFYIAGDYISVTTNWNNSKISSQNASDSGTLPGCNAYEADNREIPEITCRWELIIGFNRQDIEPVYQGWEGTAVGGYAVYDDQGVYIGGPYGGVSVWVSDKSGDRYYISWETYDEYDNWTTFSGWISTSGVSGDDPND